MSRQQFEKDGSLPAWIAQLREMEPSLFDHDKSTKFSIAGTAPNVPCAGCHKDNRDFEGKTVLFYHTRPRSARAAMRGTLPPGTLPPNKAS